jgi:RNA polymerase sigma factor (sigma-70 family)
LAPETRELVYLFYQAGRSTAEIAAIFDVPIGTVKSRLSKARAMIKKQIERIENEGPR